MPLFLVVISWFLASNAMAEDFVPTTPPATRRVFSSGDVPPELRRGRGVRAVRDSLANDSVRRVLFPISDSTSTREVRF